MNMTQTEFLKELRQAKQTSQLTKQQYKTILGQYAAGEEAGAKKGFQKLINRNKGAEQNGKSR
jgi:hypothetical protein